MRAVPISFNEAKAWIREHHRHQPAITGWLFGVQIQDDEGHRVGVAACGRPARMLQDGYTCEIVRVATDGTLNACSFAYARLRAAARELGYGRVVTYTRPDESGASLRAAGFRFAGISDGGEWSRPSRKRGPAVDSGPKLRWVWLDAWYPQKQAWFLESEHDARIRLNANNQGKEQA